MKDFFKYFTNVNRDSTRKPYWLIVKDCTTLFIKTGHLPIHYFTRFAYRKGVDKYNFITNQNLKKYLQRANNQNYDYLLNDKFVFHNILQENQITQPKFFGIIYNGIVSLRFSNKETFTNRNILSSIETIFQKSAVERLFFKKTNGRWGTGAFCVEKKTMTKAENSIRELEKGYWIIQEQLDQHKVLSNINSSSVNTLRIDTFYSNPNKIEMISALLRLGRKGSVVDNASAGGFYVGITANGDLKRDGFSFLKNGADIFQRHPDSGVKLEGLAIPFWEETISLVKKTASLFPQFRAIGWDVAITAEGPVIIEANDNYQIGMSESAAGGYAKNDVFQMCFKEAAKSKYS